MSKKYRVPEDCPKIVGEVTRKSDGWRSTKGVLFGSELQGYLNALLWAGKLEEVVEEKRWQIESHADPLYAGIAATCPKGLDANEHSWLSRLVDSLLNASPERQELAAFWLKDRKPPQSGKFYVVIFDGVSDDDYFKVREEDVYSTYWEDWDWFSDYFTTDKAEAERMASVLNKLYRDK